MPRNNVPINYTSRDFGSIKNDLIAHAKRYYPKTFKDFSDVGFGSLMMDAVAYLGDQLSFYVDYQANESFLTTANEVENIEKLAKQMGFRLSRNAASHGVVSLYVLVPSSPDGLGPDPRYIPVLRRGAIFGSTGGVNFTLNEDVRFDHPDNEVVVGRVDNSTGIPINYAIRAYGRVISGDIRSVSIDVGSFTRFLRLRIPIDAITEIISVTDSEGREYFEVDYLSQDVVYRPVLNRKQTANDAVSIMRPFNVPRRFIVDREREDVYIQFGHGSDPSSTTTEEVVDPSAAVLKMHGKNYFSDSSFDPNNLVSTDTFGIVPENTTLNIQVRTSVFQDSSAGAYSITSVIAANMDFDETAENLTSLSNVRNSLEVTNEEPITGDVGLPDTEEMKIRIFNSFSAQNRAVTREDYMSLIYQMPPIFGAVKRVNVLRDPDSFKRNLNIYVVSDYAGLLTQTNQAVKENIRTWLNKNKMINDTIDILDAKIINLGVDFEVIGDLERNKNDIFVECVDRLTEHFREKPNIGEAFFITDIFNVLRKVRGVVDVSKVKIKRKIGNGYSDIRFNVEERTSEDGRYIDIPHNAIYEIKFPVDDIMGAVK